MDQSESDFVEKLPIEPALWRDFERLIAQLHEAPGAQVEHDVRLRGRSGCEYQIDCKVEYSIGPYTFLVLVSCKDWKRRVDRPAIAELFAVMEDVRAQKGVVASASGFTEGAVTYARDKGIDLLHLRHLEDWDWEGLIRSVEITGRLLTFKLDSVRLVLPAGFPAPPNNLPGLHERDADLVNEEGALLGNAIHILNHGIPAKLQDTDDAQETTLAFPPGSHLVIASERVPVLGLKVGFHRVAYEQRIRIDAATVLKAVLENIVTGERHNITNDNKLLVRPRLSHDS